MDKLLKKYWPNPTMVIHFLVVVYIVQVYGQPVQF